jgi:membrane protein
VGIDGAAPPLAGPLRRGESFEAIMIAKGISDLFKAAAVNWVHDYAQSMGAALAFYTIFSIAPLLLIVTSIAGLVFGTAAVDREIFAQMQDLLGTPGATAVQSLLDSAADSSTRSAIAPIFGLIVLFIGATSVFSELQDALDRIWRAPVRPKSAGLMRLLHARLLSFGMILGIAFLLIVSLAVSSALSAFSRWLDPLAQGWATVANTIEVGSSVVLVTAVFALIYKTMPRVGIHWKDVWVGAAVTSLLFIAGKFLIGAYIGRSDISSGFGAAASLIVVLLWVYYTAQIFLYGAEFTWAYSHKYGSRRSQSSAGGSPFDGAPREGVASDEPAGRR